MPTIGHDRLILWGAAVVGGLIAFYLTNKNEIFPTEENEGEDERSVRKPDYKRIITGIGMAIIMALVYSDAILDNTNVRQAVFSGLTAQGYFWTVINKEYKGLEVENGD